MKIRHVEFNKNEILLIVALGVILGIIKFIIVLGPMKVEINNVNNYENSNNVKMLSYEDVQGMLRHYPEDRTFKE